MRTPILPLVVAAIVSVIFYEGIYSPGGENHATPENSEISTNPPIHPEITLSPPGPERIPSPTTRSSPTATPTPWTPNPPQVYQNLVDFCRRETPTNDARWLEGLNQASFPSDIPEAVQNELPAKVSVQPSCNFETSNEPRAIVLHYTEGPLPAAIATFQQPHKSSAHYVIDRNGKVYQFVPERFAAFHVTCYGDQRKCSPTCPICSGPNGKFLDPIYQTVGIELVNLGHVDPRYYQGDLFEDYSDSFGYRYWQDYPPPQIRSLQILVNDIRSRWGIPRDMVIGHYRINNNTDPGPALNLFWFRYGNPTRQAIFPLDETITPWDRSP